MTETPTLEERHDGAIRARIRTITTQYGEMRTVQLEREWIGNDGQSRYANDLRIADLQPAINLLRELQQEAADEAASAEEAPHSGRCPRRLTLQRKAALPAMRDVLSRLRRRDAQRT